MLNDTTGFEQLRCRKAKAQTRLNGCTLAADAHKECGSGTTKRECFFPTHCPEFDEVLHNSGTNHRTVDGGVGEKQHKVLVVGEANAVVHPGWIKQQQVSGVKSYLLKCAENFECDLLM